MLEHKEHFDNAFEEWKSGHDSGEPAIHPLEPMTA
jgi:hypothetical protein